MNDSCSATGAVKRVMTLASEPSSMPKRRTITVSGMSCTGCENTVENALRNVDGIRRVDADHNAETVEIVVDDDVSEDTIGDAVHNAGYEVVG